MSSKSINKQRESLPNSSRTPAKYQYPVAIHSAFLEKLKAASANLNTLQLQLQTEQRHMNEMLQIAKDIQVAAGEIEAGAEIRNILQGWTAPPKPPEAKQADEPAVEEVAISENE